MTWWLRPSFMLSVRLTCKHCQRLKHLFANAKFKALLSKYLPLSPIQDTNSYINCRGDKRKLQAENE